MTLKKRILDLITFLAVSIIVSAVSGCCYLHLFVKGTDGFSDLANFFDNTLVTAGLPVPALPQALVLALGAALVLQIRRFFGVTRWSGPASIFSLQYSDSSALDTRVGLGSVFAALVSCGSGAPVGQYGPVIHLGATVSKLLKERICPTAP